MPVETFQIEKLRMHRTPLFLAQMKLTKHQKGVEMTENSKRNAALTIAPFIFVYTRSNWPPVMMLVVERKLFCSGG